MGLFLLMFLPLRVIQIFTGFTFTDPEDFLPLLSVLLGFIGSIIIGYSRQEKVDVSCMALILILTLWPVMPNSGLFFMAQEFRSVTGAWPQVMVDDPRNWQGHVSPAFDALSSCVNYLHAFSGAWMLVYIMVLFAVRSRLSVGQRRMCFVALAGVLLVSVFDPGHLYAWWLD